MRAQGMRELLRLKQSKTMLKKVRLAAGGT